MFCCCIGFGHCLIPSTVSEQHIQTHLVYESDGIADLGRNEYMSLASNQFKDIFDNNIRKEGLGIGQVSPMEGNVLVGRRIRPHEAISVGTPTELRASYRGPRVFNIPGAVPARGNKDESAQIYMGHSQKRSARIPSHGMPLWTVPQ